ncbi:MAG TPA: 3-deoxy-manno-octulosonate cytidylyltransferase [Candidatus Hydrogenedentes bacterium]|jgi:3-deoxy-manno-octulosonate cytidylyltransferase (CMP-KDO synthetase)|nr:3-deoxy-manno-octulosonate cytidylyltransferase [Candidatus Hydrogenedentota bacterium]MDY0033820.1 3-deoxy-manno-octulosonate cytidylyltransferase [FCB group bacterium]NLT60788.1 3-deoxy-manno-octulosonate cytidylyltransferase [Candidatus Hydrogenedentota bacterium]HNZ20131.1 3-deoxy-manno-octulosonate cytidylyltransferase [Candidatus Hydrogenedentota bacterium]HOH33789.1 3-deoxy-manno-octulosonate cytidylyltransferase [Candidatus Hydrogenedentota bacterium]
MPVTAVPVVVGVIPARYASTRFEGKVIAPLAGKPLVVHVYERALEAARISSVIIATEDDRVRDAVLPFGARVVMTRPDHPSGTDRVAEAVADSNADIVVNIQGDEPLIDPRLIDAAIQPLVDEPAVAMATARRRLQDQRSVEDPNVVKVVCDARGRALYFSRWPIPYVRGQSPNAAFGCYWQHIGLYVYRREFLLEFARMAPTPLEQLEKLEQLRALENGYPIAVVDTEYASVGVDTPEDLKRVEMLLQQKHGENRTNA